MTSEQARMFNLIAELGGSDERLEQNTSVFIDAPLLPDKATRAVPNASELERLRKKLRQEFELGLKTLERAEAAEAELVKTKTLLQNLVNSLEGEVEEVFAGEIGDQLEEARAFLNAPADGQ